jgi:hypothetical protein
MVVMRWVLATGVTGTTTGGWPVRLEAAGARVGSGAVAAPGHRTTPPGLAPLAISPDGGQQGWADEPVALVKSGVEEARQHRPRAVMQQE